MNNPELAVDHRLSLERSRCAAENRLKLMSIAETMIFCGRQGLGVTVMILLLQRKIHMLIMVTSLRCYSLGFKQVIIYLSSIWNMQLEMHYDNNLSKLTEWQLQPQLLCGQACDGAGAMAGKSKGVAARIYSQYPKALYTHCASHRLNLCVMKCCSIREVSNMMQTADKISHFFNNSPKRQVRLEEWIESTLPEQNRKKLKELC